MRFKVELTNDSLFFLGILDQHVLIGGSDSSSPLPLINQYTSDSAKTINISNDYSFDCQQKYITCNNIKINKVEIFWRIYDLD